MTASLSKYLKHGWGQGTSWKHSLSFSITLYNSLIFSLLFQSLAISNLAGNSRPHCEIQGSLGTFRFRFLFSNRVWQGRNPGSKDTTKLPNHNLRSSLCCKTCKHKFMKVPVGIILENLRSSVQNNECSWGGRGVPPLLHTLINSTCSFIIHP